MISVCWQVYQSIVQYYLVLSVTIKLWTNPMQWSHAKCVYQPPGMSQTWWWWMRLTLIVWTLGGTNPTQCGAMQGACIGHLKWEDTQCYIPEGNCNREKDTKCCSYPRVSWYSGTWTTLKPKVKWRERWWWQVHDGRERRRMWLWL